MADERNDIPQSGPSRPGEWRDVLAPEIMERYVGKHIAIIHKRVVAAGDTYEFVREEAQKLYPDEVPYLAFIPPASQGTATSADPAQNTGGPAAADQGTSGGIARSRRSRAR